jgi:UDP-hydrolysing UDP-N-acetyl-D-glucosamine 2-epimerase
MNTMHSRPVRLASLTVARSDFGRMEALYWKLHNSAGYELLLAAGAGHHDKRLGRTLQEVEDSGLPLDCVLPDIEGNAGAHSAVVLEGMSVWLEQRRPDALLLLGDRYEMLAAAHAAMLVRVPVIHIGGGHLTLGAMDERVRHALSKLSAMHWVASKDCGARVAALHEDPATIHVLGAPELDVLEKTEVLSRKQFCAEVSLDEKRPFLLVTLHPETNVDTATNERLAQIAKQALLEIPQQILITSPCSDPGYEPFLALCEGLQHLRDDVRYFPNLGMRRYVTALNYASAMVGNSSSGIIEAASVGLPVVNIGARQAGRDRAENVLDCDFDTVAIVRTINVAVQLEFRERCSYVVNPYGNGTFSQKAMSLLDSLSWPLVVDKPWLGINKPSYPSSFK